MAFPTPAELNQYPGLHVWLRDGDWERSFDLRSRQRSRQYVRDGSVRSIDLEEDVLEGSLEIFATVEGNRARPYEVVLVLSRNDRRRNSTWNLLAECSCPVGISCKHGAAVLGKLRDITNFVPAQGSLFDTPPQATLSSSAEAWIQQLRLATEKQPKRNPVPTNKVLAYCIEPHTLPHHRGTFRLVLRPATRLKDGTITVGTTEARADPAKPPSYMSPEDLPLAALFYGLHKHRTYDAPPLRGPGWPDIIQGALDLGRLFHGATGKAHDQEGHHPLAAAPPVAAVTGWKHHDDGSARPVVTLAEPNLILLPVEPPLYLDPIGHRIGPVQSSAPVEILGVWEKGPVLRSEEIELIGEQLARLSPATPLPAPVEMPVKELTGLHPAPQLYIHTATCGGYEPITTIIGELSFRYGESPKFFPLTPKASSRESWIDDDLRLVLDRDRKAERAFEEALHDCDLIPLHEIFDRRDLGPETLHAVIVEDPLPNLQVAWLNFLAEYREDLCAKGWDIEVSSDCGLVVHDLTGFVPAIDADPDHGIDWFRFDLSGEFGERKVSLIPFIADAIEQGLPDLDDPDLPDSFLIPCEDPTDGHLRFPAKRFIEICQNVAHLFHGRESGDGPLTLDRLAAAGVADTLQIDDSGTNKALAALGRRLRDLDSLPAAKPPPRLKADLRPYQLDGYRWLRFLTENDLHGILADDMGLGKTVQTLAVLASAKRGKGRKPSLVISPTSVVGNWAAECEKFTPHLKTLVFHGSDRAALLDQIPKSDLVLTSYPLLARDPVLLEQEWNTVILDEAQYIKNPKTAAAQRACELKAAHRLCLSGTPMENHLGELWSLMRFLMPGLLGSEKTFSANIRRPIERHQDSDAQLALNRRIAPLILRRTKDQVATDLPPKTEILHTVNLGKQETDLYESVRAAMDKRVRDALADKGLAKSHIIVLDALLKLRQICCHPSLLKTPAAKKIADGSKLNFLTKRLLPELVEEGRRILLFSQFTSMLALIEAELEKSGTEFLKLTGQTKNRPSLVKRFQKGDIPIFLISLKAGGTGLNLTAADTVIHYDPWWNPAVESQATDRAHRIGQEKPVFVHKLICEGSIEERILELQKKKSALVKALLSEETSKLKIDSETISHLLAPMRPNS